MVKKADRPQHIVKTALGLAATGRWSSVSLRDIADASDVSLAEMYTLYPSKMAVLRAYFRSVDAAVLGTKFAFDDEDGPRDRLFDVLMRRFDALGEDRDGVLSILAALRCDPLSVLCVGSGLCGSMRWMLETAGIFTSGPKGRLTVKGLTALWLATLRVWERDESEDMARTMAALDRNLRRAERLRSLLPSGRRGRSGEEAEPDTAQA
jgi:AcrR family transcriptional regulator